MFLDVPLAAMACNDGALEVCLSKLEVVDFRASKSLLLRLGSKESLMMAALPDDIVTDELVDFPTFRHFPARSSMILVWSMK